MEIVGLVGRGRSHEPIGGTHIHLDRMRVRGFPFAEAVAEFIDAHEHVFVVEQNRDAQMKSMLVNELHVDPHRFTSVLHYDGTPITARFIADAIGARLRPARQPIRLS